MGMRSKNRDERNKIRREYLVLRDKQLEAEEHEWEKVIGVLQNSDKPLTAGAIAAKADTQLTINEVKGNLNVVADKRYSHSRTLSCLNRGNEQLYRIRDRKTRKFVEVDDDGNAIPGSVIIKNTTVTQYKLKCPPRGGRR